MSIALERSYSSIKECSLEENCCDKKPNFAEDPKEITKAISELVDPLSKLGLGFFPNLPKPLKYFRCSLNILDLWDVICEMSYVNANLKELKKINEVLVNMVPKNGELNSIYGLNTNALTRRDYEKLYKYYFSDYGAVKELSRGIKKELKKIEKELREVGDNQDEKNSLEARREVLENSKLALASLREKVIWSEAVDINKVNRNKCRYKFGTVFMSFVADIISLCKISTLKSALLVIKLPEIIVRMFSKLVKVVINKEKIKDEDDKEVLATVLKVPSLIFTLLEVLDKHLFKKIRERAEESRKRARNKRIIEFVKRKVGREKIDELIKGKEDLNEQIDLLKKDSSIQMVIELSKQQVDVLYAEPKGWLSWFNIKTLEDEEKMESIAKFVVKHIKELYLLEDKLEKDKAGKEVLENKLKVSYNRIKAMVLALGIEKDKVDEFINNVKNYKKRKLKEIAMKGSKKEVSPEVLEMYKRDKDEFVNDLKKAMKSEEEGA